MTRATLSLEVTVPGLRVASTANLREHHMARYRRLREQRQLVAAFLNPHAYRVPVPPCAVTLTRVGKRRMDGDNLQAALKAVRDQVAAFLAVDDGDPCVAWHYAQRVGRGYAVEIRIAEAP